MLYGIVVYTLVQKLYTERYDAEAWGKLVAGCQTETDVVVLAIQVLSQCNE